ncbi:MAG TPA: hypothetical protein VFK26_01680 [Gemmatimonadaceae bacterium]|jgi:hypothetical protein|nr:hypothetical protein [Gemmatimonadaceae bacterium]
MRPFITRRWLTLQSPLARVAISAFSIAAILSCGNDSGPRDAPIPDVSYIDPGDVLEGTASVTIRIVGGDFVRNSVVRLNGEAVATRYVDATALEADLTQADIPYPGQYLVTVFNPAPGGGESYPVQFIVREKPPLTPTLSSIIPSSVDAGTLGVHLDVIGTNFQNAAGLTFGGHPARMTTFVSSTQLTADIDAAELQDPGTRDVQVINVSGVATKALTFTISSPVPHITNVASTQNSAGSAESIMHVYGTGFIRSSVININGSPRTTQIVSHTELQTTLPATDLATPGTYQITVVNPPSPGGSSNAIPFDVVSEPLSLTGLSSYGANSGSPAFVLSLYGTGFTPTSVVRWNGSDRSTTYISSRRLTVNVLASDVAGTGTASVTVFTPGTSGGTTSAQQITIRSVGASTLTSMHTLDIPANFLIYDKISDRIYASVPPGAAANPNSVIAIDPSSEQVAGTVAVGGGPSIIALSPEGQTLWVGLDSVNQIRRIDIPSLTASTTIVLGSEIRAQDIRVKPGEPATIAVHKTNFITVNSVGTVMYVNGNQLPSTPPQYTANTSLAFNESGTFLYGYNGENTEFGFHTMQVRPDGLTLLATTTGLFDQFNANIEYAAGRVYSTNGVVVDAERRLKIGTFTSPSGSVRAVYPDPVLGRIFQLIDNTINVYDMNTFGFLGSVSLPAAVNFDRNRETLVRFASDGLAFRDGNKIYLVRTPLAAP